MSEARAFARRRASEYRFSWHPQPLPGGTQDQGFKYSFVLIADDVCILCYDNDAGKGDHKHVDGRKMHYRVADLQTLQVDFWVDVGTWEKRA